MCQCTAVFPDPERRADWERYTGQNVIKGLVSTPGDADGTTVFNLGQVFDYTHDECEKKCDVTAGCVAYTQFATWYHDNEFYASCMGRSNANDVMEPDSDVLSGVQLAAAPGK